MQKTDIGIIGLAVMGRSLALNMADHGFKVGGYNRSREVTENVIKEHPHKNLIPFYTLEELVHSQERPRKFMMMVKAGKPVDAVIGQLEPLLEEGDMEKRASTTLAWEYPEGKRVRVSARLLCPEAMNRPIRRSRLFWRQSPRKHRVSRAAHTWDRTEPATM